MEEKQPRTLEQIQATIRAARDSVWVIEDELAKLASEHPATNERKGNIDRNVAHLKLIVADEEILASGEEIGDLHAAIAAGEAKLAEDIWPTQAQ